MSVFEYTDISQEVSCLIIFNLQTFFFFLNSSKAKPGKNTSMTDYECQCKAFLELFTDKHSMLFYMNIRIPFILVQFSDIHSRKAILIK